MAANMKNFLLAGIPSMPAFVEAIDTKTLIAIISAIVLPIIFFGIGKTADICLQLYLKRRQEKKDNNDEKALH